MVAGCGDKRQQQPDSRQRIAELQDELARQRAGADETAAEVARLRGELARRDQELAAVRRQSEQQGQELAALRRKDVETGPAGSGGGGPAERARVESASAPGKTAARDKRPGAVGVDQAKLPLDLDEVIPRAVVLVEGDRGSGTGFLVAQEGKVYLYTAAHVLSGNERLTVKMNDGAVLRRFTGLEAAEGGDLVRLGVLDEVKEPVPLPLVPHGAEVPVGTAIIAWGNGGGNGVVAREDGKVLGTSDESVEVDAQIIQGNSGGPVVLASDGKVLGVVTHLTAGREDIWAAGTRHAQVRRFACRLDREWQWKSLPVTAFLQDAKRIEAFDRVTRLGMAVASLEPTLTGFRLDVNMPGGATIAKIIEENGDSRIVRQVGELNKRLGEKRNKTNELEAKKSLRGIIDECLSECGRTDTTLVPERMAWFHRRDAKMSLEWRAKAVANLRQRSESLR